MLRQRPPIEFNDTSLSDSDSIGSDQGRSGDEFIYWQTKLRRHIFDDEGYDNNIPPGMCDILLVSSYYMRTFSYRFSVLYALHFFFASQKYSTHQTIFQSLKVSTDSCFLTSSLY